MLAQETNAPRSPIARLGITGLVGALIFGAFLVWLLVSLLTRGAVPERYALFREVHEYLAYAGLAVATVMLGISVYIGLIRHGDVTPWFRRITYTVVGFMLAQGAIGGIMYLMGGRPGQDVHIIYGYGVVLSLPFFIFVEVTAQKRPAMGSYIWGFTMLAAIIVRCISTGPIG
ncbi:MAG: hypothetical protein OHK0046_10930 [Anaerolineae bacterium]